MLLVEQTDIEVHLAHVLGVERTSLELDKHIALELDVVEDEVNVVARPAKRANARGRTLRFGGRADEKSSARLLQRSCKTRATPDQGYASTCDSASSSIVHAVRALLEKPNRTAASDRGFSA